MTAYTHAFLIVVFVLGITAGAALADEQWTKDLEWCAQDCSALTCPSDILGLVVADSQTVLGTACPRKTLISLARQAARVGQRDKAFALARMCHCHNPLAQATLEEQQAKDP